MPVVGKDIEDLTEVEYLYWVGCAGALEDRAKKTTKAFAELLHIAGVKFAIMGGDEKCTGDSARRLGNEPLFQQLGKENVATLNMAFGEDWTTTAVDRVDEAQVGEEDRRDLPALPQHHRATSTRSSAATTRSSTTPSCSSTSSTRASCSRSPRSRA